MKIVFRKSFIWMLITLLALPWSPLGPAESWAQTFKPEEIDALVAPIALYPDDLLSQIFMASTYPLEVVQASRWARQNQNLKGDALAQALEKQDWDPSVKSLVNFPEVLSKMSDKLDWTQKLGDAFLEDQKQVMDAVQRLRAKAQAAGNLQTTEQQKVIVEEKVIKIESPSPQVVYVPSYNPTVVYGAWPYPAYPPYPWYPPGYAFGASMLAFGTGVALGAAWGYAWGGANWGRGDVDIDVNRNTNFNTNINRQQAKQNIQARGQREGGSFQHDPSHRKGVGYRDNATAEKFNRGGNAQQIKAREDFRGRAESGRQELARQGGAGDRGGLGEKGGLGDRGGLGDKGGLGDRGKVGDKGGLGDRGGLGDKGGVGDRGGLGDKGSLGDRGGAGNRQASLGDRGGQQHGGGLGDRAGGSRGGGGAFEGVGRGGDVRSASARGASSRGGSVSRGGGGGGRGGGGGGGGRGGGGGGRRR
jgi:Protein of unknown function (DUF3300)